MKKVPDPERYGVALIENGQLKHAIEKPKEPVSDLCITGIYMYNHKVFNKIKCLSPSARGEYEITEVNQSFISENEAGYSILDGWWTDAGTHVSYAKANKLVNGILKN